MTTHYNQGEALKAERIAVEARSIAPVMVKKGSHTHNIQYTVLRRSAYCVIELPLIAVKKRSE
jgi:hypothetical protein